MGKRRVSDFSFEVIMRGGLAGSFCFYFSRVVQGGYTCYTPMTLILNLPEDVARELGSRGEDVSRLALEALAIAGYRSGQLSEEQVRRMLGFESRWDVHAFFKERDVYLNYTMEDLQHDLEVSKSL